jgi:hypothetical protein
MPCLAGDEDGFSAADTDRRQKQKVVDSVLAALSLSHTHTHTHTHAADSHFTPYSKANVLRIPKERLYKYS